MVNKDEKLLLQPSPFVLFLIICLAQKKCVHCHDSKITSFQSLDLLIYRHHDGLLLQHLETLIQDPPTICLPTKQIQWRCHCNVTPHHPLILSHLCLYFRMLFIDYQTHSSVFKTKIFLKLDSELKNMGIHQCCFVLLEQ